MHHLMVLERQVQRGEKRPFVELDSFPSTAIPAREPELDRPTTRVYETTLSGPAQGSETCAARQHEPDRG